MLQVMVGYFLAYVYSVAWLNPANLLVTIFTCFFMMRHLNSVSIIIIIIPLSDWTLTVWPAAFIPSLSTSL